MILRTLSLLTALATWKKPLILYSFCFSLIENDEQNIAKNKAGAVSFDQYNSFEDVSAWLWTQHSKSSYIITKIVSVLGKLWNSVFCNLKKKNR